LYYITLQVTLHVTVEGCPKFVRLPDGGAAQIHAFYVNFHGIKVYSVDHFTYLLTFLDLVFPVIAGTEGPGGWLHAKRERKCADTIGTVLGWPYLMIKYKYIFQIKYTEAVLSNSTRKLLWFEIVKMLIKCSLKNEYIVLFIIIFGTLSFPSGLPVVTCPNNSWTAGRWTLGCRPT